MIDENRVELIPAFLWFCNECGTENYSRCLVPEMSEAEMDELREEHGVEAWEAGMFCCKPARVICSFCNGEFQTVDFGK